VVVAAPEAVAVPIVGGGREHARSRREHRDEGEDRRSRQCSASPC